MNKHLEQRIREQFNQLDRALLATCGPAGPQISTVTFETQAQVLYLFLAHGSDHLFHLETDANVVLLTPNWKLHGRGTIVSGSASVVGQPWQVLVEVVPVRLHILGEDRQSVVETFDL